MVGRKEGVGRQLAIATTTQVQFGQAWTAVAQLAKVGVPASGQLHASQRNASGRGLLLGREFLHRTDGLRRERKGKKEKQGGEKVGFHIIRGFWG